uniref:Integrase, catalytic region, zinc finger, CCHC-type, peptidase aspartic, catalytic n=1 Tax=Tanacetum cinerariifolium TaxID=118510 RepID=A0A699I083_TANCI|nr:integrase, catalytic region, zinc finger, CCHC-type, peptidase aspartic, catalytic [Tanacetum cinerariifolium]
MVVEDDEMSKDKEIDKLMALISLSFKKINKPTNNNLRTSSNTSRANQDNSPRINRGVGYDNQRLGHVAGAKEAIGKTVVQNYGIQCYNYKEFGHVARECQKLKRANDEAYHKEKMLLCKHGEARIQLNADQADWRDDTDDESDDQELEANYISVGMIFDGVEHCKETIAKRNYFGHIDPFIQNTIEANFCPEIRKINADLKKFHVCLKEEMVADVRYFNSLKIKVESLKSQLETQKTQFLNEIDPLSREYYYADYKNAILGMYTELDEVTNLQCDYLEMLEKCECLKKELSNSKMMSKSFEALQKHAINLERVILTTSVSRLQLKSNPMEDRVMLNNSQGKKHEIEDQHRNVKFSKNKTSVTACNDSLYAKTSNVNFVCATCGKCVLNENHDMCVLKSRNSVNSRTKMPIVVPVSTREPKRTVEQSVAKPLRKTLVEIVIFIVDSGCSKHMTGNLKLLINFVEKFLGTVKFRNDQIAPILGYRDLVQGAVTIKRVYYVEGLNHSLFSVGQFCDADLEVAFQKSTCYIHDLKGNDLLTDETPEVLIDFLRLVQRGLHVQVRIVRTDKGTKFLNKTLHAYFASEEILHQTSVARTPEQNGVVERRNRTLVEAARTMLSVAKVPDVFLNEIDRLSKEYYYADHMNTILGVYTELDEVTNLQCDYLEMLDKCECLEKELLKSRMMSKSFETLQKHALNLELELQQCKEKMKNDKSFKVNQSKEF